MLDLFSRNKPRTAWEAAISPNKSKSQMTLNDSQVAVLGARCEESPEQNLPAQLPWQAQKLHFPPMLACCWKRNIKQGARGFLVLIEDLDESSKVLSLESSPLLLDLVLLMKLILSWWPSGANVEGNTYQRRIQTVHVMWGVPMGWDLLRESLL